jgi:hypothetical protein
MRWKTLPGLMLCLAVGLLLTSCYEVKIESTFEEDGSALHSYTVTIERESLEEFGELASEFDMEEFEESAESARQKGYEAEAIDTDRHLGVRLSKQVEDNANLGQILNDMFTAGGDDAEPVTAFSGSYTRDGNKHTLNITVDSDNLFGDEFTEEEGVTPEMLSGFITMTYTARMPGEIVTEDTNGRVMSDGRIQWEIPLTGVQTFTAVSETESERNWLLIAGIIGLLGLFILGAVGLFLFLFLRGRRNQAPAPAAPAAYTGPNAPGPDAPTTRIPNVQSPPETRKEDDLNF